MLELIVVLREVQYGPLLELLLPQIDIHILKHANMTQSRKSKWNNF